MRAYILAHVCTGQEQDLLQTLRPLPGVVRADHVFGPYDIIVEVDAPTLGALGKLVFESIRCQPCVSDTLTCLAVE